MSDDQHSERRHCYRRQEDRAVYAGVQTQIDEIHKRVFNGLGLELRKEVRDETVAIHKKIGTLYKSIGGLLLTLLLIFAGIVIEGRFSSNKSSEENLRNYKAILELEQRINIHMKETP